MLKNYQAWNVTSLAIPPLGCGNGQLEWKTVGPLIYRYASQMEIPVELYAPYGTPPRELTIDFLHRLAGTHALNARTVQSAINPAWLGLVEILRQIEEAPYHWPTGRTIFQKIAYVATREGLPTGFHYERGSYGPFSKDLKNAETKLVNNNLIQEERKGKWFIVKVGPNFARLKGFSTLNFTMETDRRKDDRPVLANEHRSGGSGGDRDLRGRRS